MQHTFADRLITWYFLNGRSLPWRETRDPYYIWISEIILQQTRVAQGLEYYLRFIQEFPTLKDLALAQENEVLVLWQGLGYYSRARNLHTAAKTILNQYNGVFPKDYNNIIQLKGIGEYTASAISAFAFEQPRLAIDGNAYRVFSRYFAIELPIDKPEGQKIIKELAYSVFDPKRPDHFNQAIMDLGSGICTPKQARCVECPLQNECLALISNKVSILPFKEGKTKQRNRYFTYFAYSFNSQTYLYRRPEGDVWHGLYEFPMIESIDQKSWIEVQQQSTDLFDGQHVHWSESYLHILSHQKIHAKFLIIEGNSPSPFFPDHIKTQYELIHVNDWSKFPISRLMERFCMDENFLSILTPSKAL